MKAQPATGLVAHIAHQWFGDSVTETDWDDVWLAGDCATCFTHLFTGITAAATAVEGFEARQSAPSSRSSRRTRRAVVRQPVRHGKGARPSLSKRLGAPHAAGQQHQAFWAASPSAPHLPAATRRCRSRARRVNRCPDRTWRGSSASGCTPARRWSKTAGGITPTRNRSRSICNPQHRQAASIGLLEIGITETAP